MNWCTVFMRNGEYSRIFFILELARDSELAVYNGCKELELKRARNSTSKYFKEKNKAKGIFKRLNNLSLHPS